MLEVSFMGGPKTFSVCKMEKVYLMSLIDLLDTSKAGQNSGRAGLWAGPKKVQSLECRPEPDPVIGLTN
jgi:hypothetical protein